MGLAGNITLGVITALLAVITLNTLTNKIWNQKWETREITRSKHPTKWTITRTVTPIITGTISTVYYQTIWASLTFSVTTWLAILALETDLTSYKIPKEACWTSLAIGTLGGILGNITANTYGYSGLLSAITAFIFVGLLTGTVAFLTKGALGSGDVRMLLAFTTLAWYTGYTVLPAGILLGSILQIPFRIWWKHHFKTKYAPFAPTLILGTIIAIIWLGAPIVPCQEWAGFIPCRYL